MEYVDVQVRNHQGLIICDRTSECQCTWIAREEVCDQDGEADGRYTGFTIEESIIDE